MPPSNSAAENWLVSHGVRDWHPEQAHQAVTEQSQAVPVDRPAINNGKGNESKTITQADATGSSSGWPLR